MTNFIVAAGGSALATRDESVLRVARTAGRRAREAAAVRADWQSWHLHVDSLAPATLETALLRAVAPVVMNRRDPWFFIRYWQGGPHLRVRLAGERVDESVLAEHLAVINADLPDAQRLSEAAYLQAAGPISALAQQAEPEPIEPLRAGGVYPATYDPEFERYGGPALMALSEDLFHAGSLVALQACQARSSYAQHIGDAMEALAAGLSAWPGDRLKLLRMLAAGWSQWVDADSPAVRRLAGVATAHEQALRALADGGPSRWSAWTAPLSAACQVWVARHGVARAARILGSHLHMMQNRLGVGGAREGALTFAIGETLLT